MSCMFLFCQMLCDRWFHLQSKQLQMIHTFPPTLHITSLHQRCCRGNCSPHFNIGRLSKKVKTWHVPKNTGKVPFPWQLFWDHPSLFITPSLTYCISGHHQNMYLCTAVPHGESEYMYSLITWGYGGGGMSLCKHKDSSCVMTRDRMSVPRHTFPWCEWPYLGLCLWFNHTLWTLYLQWMKYVNSCAQI